MAPGIVVRAPARTFLHVEIWIDPPSGPAKEPEESSDQKPAFLVPGSERKTSPPPRFPLPPRLGQRAVRSETAQETAMPSRSSELLQTVPQETRCSGPAQEPEEPSDPKPRLLTPDSERKTSLSPKLREPQRLAQRDVRSETAQETAAPSRPSELVQTVPQEARCSVSRSFQIEPQAAQPGGPRRGFPLQESAPGSKKQ